MNDMDDLISRSAVIKALEECNLDKNLFEKDVFEKINAIPTAYDISKVVTELEDMMPFYPTNSLDECTVRVLIDAIGIVRKGGIDE